MKLSLPWTRQACSNLHVLIRATALVSPFLSLLLSDIYLLRGSSPITLLLNPSWLSWGDFFPPSLASPAAFMDFNDGPYYAALN